MNDLELLAELIGDLARDLRPVIEPLTADEIAWQPGQQANSIGVTLWHIGRGLDLLAVRVLQNKPPEEELWHTLGWRERTGYDPRGFGYGGWGVLTGYSWEDVQRIPALSAGELLEYLHQTSTAAAAQVANMGSEEARQPAPGLMDGRLTYFRWIKEFYKGFQAHVGEIVAIKELMSRA
jgi:DinB superfamily